MLLMISLLEVRVTLHVSGSKAALVTSGKYGKYEFTT